MTASDRVQLPLRGVVRNTCAPGRGLRSASLTSRRGEENTGCVNSVARMDVVPIAPGNTARADRLAPWPLGVHAGFRRPRSLADPDGVSPAAIPTQSPASPGTMQRLAGMNGRQASAWAGRSPPTTGFLVGAGTGLRRGEAGSANAQAGVRIEDPQGPRVVDQAHRLPRRHALVAAFLHDDALAGRRDEIRRSTSCVRRSSGSSTSSNNSAVLPPAMKSSVGRFWRSFISYRPGSRFDNSSTRL